LRRVDAEAAASASESAACGASKGRLFQSAATAPANFDALDNFLRENKKKRLVCTFTTLLPLHISCRSSVFGESLAHIAV